MPTFPCLSEIFFYWDSRRLQGHIIACSIRCRVAFHGTACSGKPSRKNRERPKWGLVSFCYRHALCPLGSTSKNNYTVPTNTIAHSVSVPVSKHHSLHYDCWLHTGAPTVARRNFWGLQWVEEQEEQCLICTLIHKQIIVQSPRMKIECGDPSSYRIPIFLHRFAFGLGVATYAAENRRPTKPRQG